MKIPTQKQAVVSGPAFNHGSGSPRKRQTISTASPVGGGRSGQALSPDPLLNCRPAWRDAARRKKKKKEKIRNGIREMISCCTSRFSWTHARQRLGSGKAAVCCTVAEWRTLSRLPKARIPQETHTHESHLREGLDSVMDSAPCCGDAPVSLREGPIHVLAPSHCRGWTDSLSDWKRLLMKLICS